MHEHTKKQILWVSWNITACGALAIAIVSHMPSLATRLTTQPDGFFGDMYTINKVDAFQLPIQYNATESKTTLEQADAVALGDSFFNVRYGAKRFADQFAKETGIKTAHASTTYRTSTAPVFFFQDNIPSGQATHTPRLLIWEQVERGLVDGATITSLNNPSRDIESFIPASIRATPTYQHYMSVRTAVFDPIPVSFFIQNTHWVEPAFSFLYSLRFKLTGDISPRTPEYSLDPKMVFYDVEIKNARTQVKDAEVSSIADRIQKQIAAIKTDYGIDTVYIPLPSKYTVYRDLLADSSYNQLLPRLVAELHTRGVRVLDVLPLFEEYKKTHDDLLYYPTDTHWSPTGEKIVLHALTSYLQEQQLIQ